MTMLTTKERAQVNAALCIVHDGGHDAKAITAAAAASIALGNAPNAAYSVALNAFAGSNPGLAPALSKVTRLIQASSPESVARYDQALSRYIETGDNGALVALAPMMAADSVALAIRHGEMTEADGAEGATMALGGEPTAIMQSAFQAARAGTEDGSTASTQLSPVDGAGLVASKAQSAHAHYSGFVPDGPGPGVTLAAAREAARIGAAAVSQAGLTPTGEQA